VRALASRNGGFFLTGGGVLDVLGGNHDPHANWHGGRPRARARPAVT